MNTEIIQAPCLKKQYMNITKVARKMTNSNLKITDEAQTWMIPIKNHIATSISMHTDLGIRITEPIGIRDLILMDAVYTLYMSDQRVFSVEWVARAMSGDLEQRVTPANQKRVQERLERLSKIRIQIDCECEFSERKEISDTVPRTYEGYLLPLEYIEGIHKTNGKRAPAYKLLEVPPLYQYAQVLHQIADVPIVFFDTPPGTHHTDEEIMIKRYVIKRLLHMKSKKGGHNHSQKLSFLWYDKDGCAKGLFPELGYLEQISTKRWRSKVKPRIIEIVRQTLDVLIEKGFIQGYEPYRELDSKNPSVPIMGYIIYQTT